jgi:hypothetical protein
MAATLETAARGIVYEHETASLPAQRVLAIFRALHAEIETRRPTPAKVLGVAFRRLELASRTAAEQVGGGETAFLDFVDRLAAGAAEGGRAADAGSAPETSGGIDDRRDTPRIILP